MIHRKFNSKAMYRRFLFRGSTSDKYYLSRYCFKITNEVLHLSKKSMIQTIFILNVFNADF